MNQFVLKRIFLMCWAVFFTVFVGFAAEPIIQIDVAGKITQEILPSVIMDMTQSGDIVFSPTSGDWMSECGEPQIPYKVITLLVPPSVNLDTVSFEELMGQYERVDGEWSITPVPPMKVGEEDYWGGSQTIVDGKDQLVYAVDAFWPIQKIRISSIGMLRDWKLVEVSIPLVRYNPVVGALEKLVLLDVRMKYENELDSKTKITSKGVTSSRFALQRVQAIASNVDNFSALYMGNSKPTTGISGYGIVVSTELQAALGSTLTDFVAHKTSRGFNVHIITEVDTGSEKNAEAPKKLRDWLLANYQALDLKYLLILGNPTPSLSKQGYFPMKPAMDGFDIDIPTDYFYSELNCDWDKDQDGEIAERGANAINGDEIERYCELIVGRIPYYSAALTPVVDMVHILEKTMTYETATNTDWRNSVFCSIVPLFRYWMSYDIGEYFKDSICRPMGLTVNRLYRSAKGQSASEHDFLERPFEFSVETEIKDVLANNLFGFVFFSAHGSSDSMDAGPVNGNLNWIFSDDFDVLDDSCPIVTFQSSCTTAFPESRWNVAYSILRHGGIATCGATRQAIVARPTDYGNGWGADGMGTRYFIEIVKGATCGESFFDLKETTTRWSAYNWAVYNLYGDPSIQVYAQKDLSISPLKKITSSQRKKDPLVLHEHTYTLVNEGDNPLSWTVSKNVTWLDLSQTSGVIPAGGSTTFVASINESATNLVAALHKAEITIMDSNTLTPRIFKVEYTVTRVTLPTKNEWALLYVDNKQSGHNGDLVFDNSSLTYWATKSSSAFPHEIQIDLKANSLVTGVSCVSRDGVTSERIGDYELYLSEDSNNWGSPVATGRFEDLGIAQEIMLSTPVRAHYLRLKILNNVTGGNTISLADLNVFYTPSDSISQARWALVYVDSAKEGHPGEQAFDGDVNTTWQTVNEVLHPHEIQVDLGGPYDLYEFSYTPRSSGWGRAGDYELYVSDDPAQWGSAVSTGWLPNTSEKKTVCFSKKRGRYIRFVNIREVRTRATVIVPEINMAGEPFIDPNNQPPSLANASFAIAESQAFGTSVGTMSGSDPDQGDVLHYTITSGNDDGTFVIHSITGEITVAGIIDYETQVSYLLTINVADFANATASATASISISNVPNDDSDSDGLIDEWEVTHFGSTTAQEGAGDPDNDGANNRQEQNFNTLPNDPSSAPSAEYLGLVGWWKLDGGSGTNVVDSSGNNHSGTVEGGADWMAGHVGNHAFNLDGTNAVFTSIPGGEGNNATFTGWIKRNGTQVDYCGVVFMRGNGASTGVNLVNNTLRYHWNGGKYGWNSGLTPPDGEWCFFALVINPTQATMYMGTQSGGFQSAVTTGTHSPETFSAPFVIGKDAGFDTRFYKGGIDDVRFYTRSLTASEIAQLYDPNNQPPVASDSTFMVDENAVNGTGVGTVSATDPGDTLSYAITAGNGSGSFAINSTSGEISVASALDYGVTSTYALTVSVTDGVFSDTATITINLNPLLNKVYLSDINWVSATTGWGSIKKDLSVGSNIIQLDGIAYTKGMGTHAQSEITYNLAGIYTTFHSVVGVDDETGSNGSVIFKVYGDDLLLHQTAVINATGTETIDVDVSGVQTLKLVADSNGSNAHDHADWANAYLLAPPDIDSDGLADEWETTHFGNITAQDGAGDPDNDGASNRQEQTFNTDPMDANDAPSAEYINLRGWWKLDETAGTVAADSSGNGLNASNVNGVLVNQLGHVNGAFGFDGNDDSSATQGTAVPGSDLTITAWIRPDNLSGSQTILSKDSSIVFKLYGSALRFTTPGHRDHSGSRNLIANEWQFVAVTFVPNTTGGCRFYRNGAFTQMTTSYGMTLNGNPFVLGQNQWGERFDGRLDDIRLYNRILTDSEIGALYQQDAGVYNVWKGTQFTAAELANPAISGDAADVDADQLSNLIEYALGLDPKTHSGSFAGCAIELDGSNGWKVEFNRHASHSDIDLILEWTDELNPANWQPVAQSIAGGVVQPLNGTTLVSETGSEPTIVELNVPSTVPHGFIRWKVTRR